VIEQIQFSFSITDSDPIIVAFFGFDLENHFSGFAETVPAPDLVDPNPLNIRTYTMQGTPVSIDNSTWAYVLRYGPHEPGPSPHPLGRTNCISAGRRLVKGSVFLGGARGAEKLTFQEFLGNL
jgi:hypothetical protein